MRLITTIFLLLFCCISTALGDNPLNGTVIVWQNGNYLNVIQRQTDSNMTHAAIILYEGSQAWVYEASRPDVHRYTLEAHYRSVVEQKRMFPNLKVHYLQPSRPYNDAESEAMKRYADKCLGVMFGVRTYMTGRPGNTLHCCEFVGNTLSCSGRFRTTGPRENPKTIYDKASKL